MIRPNHELNIDWSEIYCSPNMKSLAQYPYSIGRNTSSELNTLFLQENHPITTPISYTLSVMYIAEGLGNTFRNKKPDYFQKIWSDRALDNSHLPLGIIPGFNSQMMSTIMNSLVSTGSIDVQFCKKIMSCYSKQVWFVENVPSNQFGVFRGVHSPELRQFIKNIDVEKSPGLFDDASCIIRGVPILFHFLCRKEKVEKQLQEMIILNTLISTCSSASCVSTFSYLFFLRKCMFDGFLKKPILECLELLLAETEIFEDRIPSDLFSISVETSRTLKSLIKYMSSEEYQKSNEDQVLLVKKHVQSVLQKSENYHSISAFLVSIVAGFLWNVYPVLTVIRAVFELIGDETEIYASLVVPFCVINKLVGDVSIMRNVNFPGNLMNQLIEYNTHYKFIGDFVTESSSNKVLSRKLGNCIDLEYQVTKSMIVTPTRDLVSKNTIMAKEIKNNMENTMKAYEFPEKGTDKEAEEAFNDIFDKFAKENSLLLKFMNPKLTKELFIETFKENFKSNSIRSLFL